MPVKNASLKIFSLVVFFALFLGCGEDRGAPPAGGTAPSFQPTQTAPPIGDAPTSPASLAVPDAPPLDLEPGAIDPGGPEASPVALPPADGAPPAPAGAPVPVVTHSMGGGGGVAPTAASGDLSDAPSAQFSYFLRALPKTLPSGAMITEKTIAKMKEGIEAKIKKGKTISSLYPALRSIARRLNFKSDDVVAHISAGTGILELIFLEEKTPFKKLYAVEIDTLPLSMMDFLLGLTDYAGREKIVAVTSTPVDVNLSPDSIDVAILVNANFYMGGMGDAGEIKVEKAALACLKSLHKAVKPGGLVHVFHISQGVGAGARSVNFVGDQALIVPFTQAGFKHLKTDNVVFDKPHFHAVFKK